MLIWDLTRVWTPDFFSSPRPPKAIDFLLFYGDRCLQGGGPNWREASMEYFMVPAQKVPSLQHFRKTEKEVIGGLCRYVSSTRAQPSCVYYCYYKTYVWRARTRRWGNMLELICYCVHDPLTVGCGHQLLGNIGTISRLINSGYLAEHRQPHHCDISHILQRNRRILWRTNINHVVRCTPRCCLAYERIHAVFILKLPPGLTYKVL